MKRTLGYSILTGLILLALAQMATGQPVNYLTRAILQARSWTFTALQTFSGGVTVSGTGVFKRTNIKTIEICPVGCQYTTLNAACAGETSTAASPIDYRIGPGVYDIHNDCQGEDGGRITGSGMRVTVLDDTVGAQKVIELGNSKNMTVESMTIKGDSGIAFNPTAAPGGGGGRHRIRNVEFDNRATFGGGQDCVLVSGASTAGTEFWFVENICRAGQDTWAFVDAGDINVYSIGNFFTSNGQGATGATGRSCMLMSSIPCRFESIGDTFDWTQAYTVDHTAQFNGLVAYMFDGGTAGCSTTPKAVIRAASVKMTDTSTNGTNGTVAGIRVLSTAAELTSLLVHGSSFDITQVNDTSGGRSHGIDNAQNSTTVVTVNGTRIRTSGGNATYRLDLMGNTVASIIEEATDWVTDDGNLTPLPVKNLNVVTSATFNDPATINYKTTASSSIGLMIDNTDEANNETSPYSCMANSTSGAGDGQICWQVDTDGHLHLLDDAFADKVYFGVVQTDFYTNIGLLMSGGNLIVGNNTANDTNRITFDAATTDGQIRWNDTINLMDIIAADQIGIPCVTTMPTCNTAGRIVCDGDGTVGMCFCNGTSYLAMTAGADCT